MLGIPDAVIGLKLLLSTVNPLFAFYPSGHCYCRCSETLVHLSPPILRTFGEFMVTELKTRLACC
jgi:hypothetical protein